MKLKLNKKVLLDWKRFLEKFDCEMKKETPFILQIIHIRLILGMQSDVVKKQKRISSLRDEESILPQPNNVI